MDTTTTIQFKYATLDGLKIAYTNETKFYVQTGKGRSSYTTKYSFTGNLADAVYYYKCINIGNGYKKRLLMPSCGNNPVLAKSIS